MRVRCLLAACLALLLSSAPASAEAPSARPPQRPAASDPKLLEELLGISQQIVDSVIEGDKSVLQRHAAPDLLFINRDGKVYTKEQLLSELVPRREGYQLKFTILEPKLVRQADAAVFTFLLDESLK